MRSSASGPQILGSVHDIIHREKEPRSSQTRTEGTESLPSNCERLVLSAEKYA
jgi:hypothetical protein